MDAGLAMGLDLFALSFVRRREDLDPVRRHLAERGSEAPLIAKIEKPQAAANAEEIIDASDGIMIAAAIWGSSCRSRRRPGAEAPAGGRRPARHTDHHRHPDARVDGPLDPAHPGRGRGRGQRDLRRDRRGDALAGDRRWSPPGAGGADDGVDRRDGGARAARRPLAGRARAAGQQPVPRDRVRRGGRRVPVGAQGDRVADQHRDHRAPDLGLPPEGAGARARTQPRRRAALPAALGSAACSCTRSHWTRSTSSTPARTPRSGPAWPGPATRSGSRQACHPAAPAAPTCSRSTPSNKGSDPQGVPRLRSRKARAFSMLPQVSIVHQRPERFFERS